MSRCADMQMCYISEISKMAYGVAIANEARDERANGEFGAG